MRKRATQQPTEAAGNGVWNSIFVAGFAVILAIPGGLVAPVLLSQLYAATFRIGNLKEPPTASALHSFWNVLPVALLGGIIGIFVGNAVYAALVRAGGRWRGMDTGDKVTLFVGTFIGIMGSTPIIVLLSSLKVDVVYVPLAVIGLTLGFSSMAIYALQSVEDLLPWTKSRARGKRTGIKILDTNVIIDGRIYDVAKSGFLEGQLYVPGFVLDELQHIADHHDALRRQRGRRGLEVLKHMQAEFPLEVRSHDRHAPDTSEPVDSRLVRLAKAIGGDIVTNDFNLNRVATLQEVKVLSLNDLALALRSNIMPQETMAVTVIREGNQLGQGIGYLEDGTMVVVENGQAHIGESLIVSVTQVIQTERGKMIFGRAESDEDAASRRKTASQRGS